MYNCIAFYVIMVDLPVTGKLHTGGFWLTLFSDQHFIQKPTTTSTPAIMTNPHPPEGPEWYSLYYKLICLRKKCNVFFTT